MTSGHARVSDPGSEISDASLAELSGFVAARLGLDFPGGKRGALKQGVSSAARDAGFEHPESYIRWILSSSLPKEQIEFLASRLTVGETYFLREKRSLEILEEEILPAFIRTRRGEERQLRIWSAGCSTGEEPFSLAIILSAMGALRDWRISILATDVNPDALHRARQGVYDDWSFRDVPPGFQEKNFRKTAEGRFEVLPNIRDMVRFSSLNLAEETYPSPLNDTHAMDVIFCRNVMMYFTPELAKKVVARFHLSLVNGGWLVVSPCETSQRLSRRFTPVRFPDAILYRKAPPIPARHPPVNPVPSPRPVPGPAAPQARSVVEEPPALSGRGLAPAAAPDHDEPPSQHREPGEALVLRCRASANEGRLTEALELSDQAIAADKMNAGLHYLRATILQEQGAADEAASALKRALYLDQDLVLAHVCLAHLALRQGKDRAARKHFENALSLLGRYRQEDVLPESEGMSAGRLREIIQSIGLMRDRDE